jgi:RNA polymerase sigma factor (TIGR02999 family)
MSNERPEFSQIEAVDAATAAKLFPLVYDELRRLATARVAQEKPGQTLDATALVHEVYLRLMGDRVFVDRGHFFRLASEAMRRILIDRARRKRRLRHGGDRERVPLSDVEQAAKSDSEQLLAMNDALERFSILEPAKAELVKLRYFAGLTEDEAAAALGISRATASRHWNYARAWLIGAVDDAMGPAADSTAK